MGLFNKLGGLATKVIDSGKEAYEKELERCESWDDERLKREAMTTSSVTKKMAYVRELQNRGYSSEDFK